MSLPAKYYCYYLPKVVFGSIFLTLVEGGLLTAVILNDDLTGKIICAVLLLLMSVFYYFFINDGFLPAMRKQPVLKIDEDGITDMISWGLIKWTNISKLNDVLASGGVYGGGYTFTELHIKLNDVNAYDGYRESWWIRMKIRYIRVMKDKRPDIVIDIDALNGDVKELYKEVLNYYLHATDASPENMNG